MALFEKEIIKIKGPDGISAKRKESIVVSLFLPVICVYERALVYNSIQRVPSYPLHSSGFFRVGTGERRKEHDLKLK